MQLHDSHTLHNKNKLKHWSDAYINTENAQLQEIISKQYNILIMASRYIGV